MNYFNKFIEARSSMDVIRAVTIDASKLFERHDVIRFKSSQKLSSIQEMNTFTTKMYHYSKTFTLLGGHLFIYSIRI